MILTLEALETWVAPGEACHEATEYGFKVWFRTSELDCYVHPDNSVSFVYRWGSTIIFETTATEETMLNSLRECNQQMWNLDQLNRDTSDLRHCDCCNEDVEDDGFGYCNNCHKSRCRGCMCESEECCRCCFYGLITVCDVDDVDLSCQHCAEHGRHNVVHTEANESLANVMDRLSAH